MAHFASRRGNTTHLANRMMYRGSLIGPKTSETVPSGLPDSKQMTESSSIAGMPRIDWITKVLSTTDIIEPRRWTSPSTTIDSMPVDVGGGSSFLVRTSASCPTLTPCASSSPAQTCSQHFLKTMRKGRAKVGRHHSYILSASAISVGSSSSSESGSSDVEDSYFAICPIRSPCTFSLARTGGAAAGTMQTFLLLAIASAAAIKSASMMSNVHTPPHQTMLLVPAFFASGVPLEREAIFDHFDQSCVMVDHFMYKRMDQALDLVWMKYV